jgi:superfamily II DNA helicase RecQ
LRIYQIQSFFGQCYERIFGVQQFMKIKLLKKLEETLNKGVSSDNRVFFDQEASSFANDNKKTTEHEYRYDYSLQHTMNNSLKLSNFEKNLNFSNKINNPKQNQIEMLSQDNHKKIINQISRKNTKKETIESIPSTRGPTKSLVIKPKHNFQDLNPSCDLISNSKIDNKSENILSNDNDWKFEKKKIKNEKIQQENLETFNLNKEDLIKSFEDVYPDLYEIVFSLNGHLIDQQSGCESVVHDKLQNDLNFDAQGNYI